VPENRDESHHAHGPAPTPAEEHANHDPARGGDGANTLPADFSRATPAQVFGIEFMRRALLSGLLVSGVCAFLGMYVVLRRMVFLGVALSQMASAGVALSLLTNTAPMLGSAALMLAGVGLMSFPWAPRKVRQDAFTGVGYAVASALGVLLLAKSPQGAGHLLNLLFGNILLVSQRHVILTALVLGGVVLLHTLFGKEMLFVSFDADSAGASGYKTRLWEALLYLSIGLTIAFAIHAVGVLLTFSSLVLPAVTALLVTRRWRSATLAALLVGLIPVPIGLYLSFVWDLPPAATIVAFGFGLLLVAGLISRLLPRARA
jgi:ABC-type Mn2+/Zn2+ transport system permease subunit